MTARDLPRSSRRDRPSEAPSPRPPPRAEGPSALPARPGWRESLPFFVIGGASLAVAIGLLLIHSPSALGRLPVWTFLVAIGSISLVGGTVASLVGEPIPDLPGENELVGADLIVVSRARWSELQKMEQWVEGRLAPPPGPAVDPPAPATVARARARPEVAVPTLDDLLADLPVVSEEDARKIEPWTETDESREAPPPSRSTVTPPTPAPAPSPPPRRASGRTAPPRAGAKAEASAPARTAGPELERLLNDLESAATKAIEERKDDGALLEPGVLTCTQCQRGIGITEAWENCEECLATYCARCADQLAQSGDRRLCPTCRALPKTGRR